MFSEFVADYARREKHRTAMTYHRLLSQFERWLDEQGIKEFDREHVLEFLETRRWSNASRNCFLAALRGWARDAKAGIASGVTQEELRSALELRARLERLEGLRDFRVERREKPALSLEQISEINGVMDPETSCLFWIYLWFGFRLGELKLIGNVDWGAGRLEVETEKVGGSRALFFDEYTAKILRHAFDSGLIDLPDISIWKRFRKYSGCCAPAKLTPHLCRHTFATHFSTITDQFTLKRMLGHGFRSATDVYVHRFDEQIREVMVERHYLKPLEPRGGAENGA